MPTAVLKVLSLRAARNVLFRAYERGKIHSVLLKHTFRAAKMTSTSLYTSKDYSVSVLRNSPHTRGMKREAEKTFSVMLESVFQLFKVLSALGRPLASVLLTFNKNFCNF